VVPSSARARRDQLIRSILGGVAALAIGIGAMLFCYYLVSIPILPCLSVYAVGMLFNDGRTPRIRSLLVILFGLASIALYGTQAVMMIVQYPKYGNWFGVILEWITTFAFLGATVLNSSGQFSGRARESQ